MNPDLPKGVKNPSRIQTFPRFAAQDALLFPNLRRNSPQLDAAEQTNPAGCQRKAPTLKLPNQDLCPPDDSKSRNLQRL